MSKYTSRGGYSGTLKLGRREQLRGLAFNNCNPSAVTATSNEHKAVPAHQVSESTANNLTGAGVIPEEPETSPALPQIAKQEAQEVISKSAEDTIAKGVTAGQHRMLASNTIEIKSARASAAPSAQQIQADSTEQPRSKKIKYGIKIGR